MSMADLEQQKNVIKKELARLYYEAMALVQRIEIVRENEGYVKLGMAIEAYNYSMALTISQLKQLKRDNLALFDTNMLEAYDQIMNSIEYKGYVGIRRAYGTRIDQGRARIAKTR